MNQTTTLPLFASPTASARSGASGAAAPAVALEAMQSRFALRVASRLTESADAVSPDVSERLRFAREQALERARAVRAASAEPSLAVTRGGAVVRGRAGSGWWLKFASVVPVFALIGGLVLIQRWQDNVQISTAADVDAALLSDDLPPTAYSDAGFAEFLKTPNQ